MKPSTFIDLYEPCEASILFISKLENMAEAWSKCPFAPWLFWTLRKLDLITLDLAVDLTIEISKYALDTRDPKYIPIDREALKTHYLQSGVSYRTIYGMYAAIMWWTISQYPLTALTEFDMCTAIRRIIPNPFL
jgi:hypothetical protein